MQSRTPCHIRTIARRAAVTAPVVVGAAIVALEAAAGADLLAVGLTLIVIGVVAATTCRALAILGARLTRLEQGLARVTGMQQQHDEDLVLLATQQMDATAALKARVEPARRYGPRGDAPSGANRLN